MHNKMHKKGLKKRKTKLMMEPLQGTPNGTIKKEEEQRTRPKGTVKNKGHTTRNKKGHTKRNNMGNTKRNNKGHTKRNNKGHTKRINKGHT